MLLRHVVPVLLAATVFAVPAHAQEEARREPFRTRVTLGPQLVPGHPGSDELSLRPFVDVARARGDNEFEFEAPDESFGFPVLRASGFAIGPAIGFEGKRDADAVGAPIHKVGFSVEAGAFVQTWIGDALRVRVEGRKGVTGHRGWTGVVSADYVAREGDDWLFSIGPRITLSDTKYHRAYFGITPADAAASGLPVHDPKGGIQAAGVTAGYLRQLSRRWGVATYARYDRLTGDAADSPVARSLGSRDQFSGGIALSYTFGTAR
ncbi:MAG TPA: MipA/OmpV family protein [Sphingomonas sp.]|jgi:outer membrane scaffolding protein for murein synthesis (MipA/OmpV family)|nr:MipA/OmpV family protein [Sphingomonas sp.]